MFKKENKNTTLFILLGILLTLLITVGILFLQTQKSSQLTELVSLDSGEILGEKSGEVYKFLGIPYAQPPVGDLRWQATQKVQPWQGVRGATKFANVCPQPDLGSPGAIFGNEDCLYLNVWTPAEDMGEKLPVMVWIHGGAFMAGAGSLDMYDGEKLAEKDVVVVTVNYRLGPFGYLVHPDLAKESSHNMSGNYALLDQIQALQWVKKNIKAFGGDSNNVTIFGESAGSVNNTSLMLSPLAKNLFARVIAESGTSLLPPLGFPETKARLDLATKTGEEFASVLGCEAEALVCMRQKTTEEIMQVANLGFGLYAKGFEFPPVVDGWVIPEDPREMFASGKFNKVPLLIGTNKDEGTIFLADAGVSKIQEYEDWVNQIFPDQAEEILEKYAIKKQAELWSVFNNVYTRAMFANPAKFVADEVSKKSDVYLYQFTHTPPTEWGRELGAHHGAEINYVFGNLDYDKELSDAIMERWVNFAKTGNPNSTGLLDWPKYDNETQNYLELGDKIEMKSNLETKVFDFLD